MQDERDIREEEEAAAEEAARIGGRGTERSDEAERAAPEPGGGEAEGFEEAEQLLEEAASHGDPAPDPSKAGFDIEDEEDPSVHGEPDESDSTESTEG